jgi:hypothetical protein
MTPVGPFVHHREAEVMNIKTWTVVAASILGTLGVADKASAQVMYGYPRPTGTPAMYSADYRAPVIGGNVLTSGYNQYNAGSYYPSPYTAGASNNYSPFQNSHMGFNNFNNWNNGYNNFSNFNNFNNWNNSGMWYNGRGAAFGNYRGRW